MFIAMGFLTPFVWSLGYVWVDTLLPHRLSYSLLASLPAAFIMGAGAVIAYLLQDRRSPPKITLAHVLVGVLAIWITLTTSWAVAPGPAWFKWDASFKTVIFCAFMPFVFRSRVQIEAYLLVFLFSAAGHLLPWGLKTALTGGGYQMSLGLMGVNTTLLAESSTVAAVTVMFVPLLFWVRTHSLLIPNQRLRSLGAAGLTFLYLLANIGTFARTGLIGLALLGLGMLMRTKRKLVYLAIAGILGGATLFFLSDRWTSRISTISDYEQESSAYTRILVWKWTLKFVASNPLGGGFNAYVINRLEGPDGSVQFGRAFHNMFFAALGEHGIPGLVIYVTIFALCLLQMQKVIKQSRDRPDLAWAGDLARAVQLGFVILLACGNFVDISFSFIVWDMVALMMCLRAHVSHVLAPVPLAKPRFGAVAVPEPSLRPAGAQGGAAWLRLPHRVSAPEHPAKACRAPPLRTCCP